MAALLILGPIFEADLLRNQYGFRPQLDGACLGVMGTTWRRVSPSWLRGVETGPDWMLLSPLSRFIKHKYRVGICGASERQIDKNELEYVSATRSQHAEQT
jgi:hypothetical protein